MFLPSLQSRGRSHVWVFEDPVVREEYCVSILFISLLYKQQQGEGTYWAEGKGHRPMKCRQGAQRDDYQGLSNQYN